MYTNSNQRKTEMSNIANINGQGLIMDSNFKLIEPVSGHNPVTAVDLLNRAENARVIAQRYIYAANNMERLAKETLDKSNL